jgi:hypothetical protein
MTIAIGTVEGRWVWNGTRWSCAMPPASPPTPPCPPGTGPFIPPASVDVPQFANVAAVTTANIPCGNEIQTLGYYTAGDGGGATYVFAPVQSNAMDGNIQSKDGQWWQYVPETRGVNCKSFGARADAADTTPLVGGVYGPVTITGTDNTAFIQAAVNFALRKKVRTVFLPGGNYVTTGTIHLGWGDALYSLNFEGDGGGPQGFAGTTIYFTAPNMQCVDVSGARANIIRSINFFFPRNYYWVYNNIWNVRPSDVNGWTWTIPTAPSGWVDPGLVNALAANAPLAAITVDAFAGSAPTPSYPPVTYPSWTGLTTQYGRTAYSSNVKIRDCTFRGWPAAIVVGVNQNAQGDFTVVNDCLIAQGAYGISINNTQSRNVDVKNITFQYLNTVLDNSSFGPKSGEWAGPISNLSGGETYQIFNFGGISGPLTISNVYCEGGLRRFGQWFGYNGLKLENWLVSFYDSQYEASRALVECYIYSGEVIFERCTLNAHYGIQGLVYGNVARTVIGSGCYINCGARFPNTTPAGWQAARYGGGLLMNVQASYPAAQNRRIGTSTLTIPYTASSSFQTTTSDTDCANIPGQNYMFVYREGLQSFSDLNARQWRIKQVAPLVTPVGAGVISKTSGVISGMSQTGEVLTFTITISGGLSSESQWGYNNWGFSVGDILIDQPTGAILVVTAKTGTAPTYTVTAIQQNCYTNYPGGSWTTTTVLSNGTATTVPTSGGFFQIVRTSQVFSQRVYFGDFTSGSANVANIHTGDLDGSAAATYLLAGTLLFAPGLRNTATTYQPIANEFPVTKNTYIGVVTNGTSTTGATMTLTLADGVTAQNAIATGRYPITPLGISQGV